MAADDDDQRSGPDPFACGFGGVKIVDRAAGGIPSVQRILRRAIGAGRHGLVELAVADAGEGAVLIDDACKKLGYEPKVVKYIAYCGRYSLQFYLFTFAYPVIRTIVVNTLHVTSPFLIFSLVLIMQLVIMTLIVELTRNVKILKIPMGY